MDALLSVFAESADLNSLLPGLIGQASSQQCLIIGRNIALKLASNDPHERTTAAQLILRINSQKSTDKFKRDMGSWLQSLANAATVPVIYIERVRPHCAITFANRIRISAYSMQEL